MKDELGRISPCRGGAFIHGFPGWLVSMSQREARGCQVESVETDNRGFDLISRRPHPEDPKTFIEVRFIEVKGRAGVGEIALTANEYKTAGRLKADYWLYAIYHCATPTPQMIRVQDPFEKLLVRPFIKTQVVETVREVGGVRIAHAQVVEVGEV